MDTYEATKTVLSRLQNLDPENASKIMGYILIQDQSEKEMIRLAFGPETVLISLINQAKIRLGISSNTSSALSTSSFSSVSNASKFNPFQHSSPRVIIPNNGFQSSPWSNGSPLFLSRSVGQVSYAPVVNGSTNNAFGSSPSEEQFFFNELFEPVEENGDQDQFFHRRSCSVNDAFLGGFDDNVNDNVNGFGCLGPCMYYARGFCKNGNSCKFMHGGFGDCSSDESSGGAIIGSPSSNIDCSEEQSILRVKALQQQQRFAAANQLMGSGGRHPFGYNGCMNFFNDNQRSATAALLRGDEFHRHGRSLPDRNEFSAMALGSNSSLRQIYLTFPADSTFKEEDVSNYFSMYGPVQDVRIPYQQKRMFGFVTFIYPETVKLILAKGNPHFVCDSRVLVKPYKEKGKIPDKKLFQLQQQPIDREEFSACLSPSRLEPSELYDIPFGARMSYNPHGMMLRRKMEQDAELQHTIELQGRRLMNLQLMKNHHHSDYFHPSVSPGVPSASQMQTQFQNNPGLVCLSHGINQEALAENNGVQESMKSPANAADENQEMPHTNDKNGICSKEETSNTDDSDPQESSLDHILPDNLFASPTKSAAEQHVAFSVDSAAADAATTPPATATTKTTATTNNIPLLPTTSPFSMASLKSCYFQVPRFTSGQEATET